MEQGKCGHFVESESSDSGSFEIRNSCATTIIENRDKVHELKIEHELDGKHKRAFRALRVSIVDVLCRCHHGAPLSGFLS